MRQKHFEIMNIGLVANREKIGALASYIGFRLPDVELRKLLKLFYLIDEEAVRERAFPITWLNYMAWEKGPVSPDLYAIKDGSFCDYVVCKKNAANKWVVSSVNKAEYPVMRQMRCLSENERKLVDRILEKYGSMSADELTSITHRDGSLWSQAVARAGIDFCSTSESNVQIDLNALNSNNPDAQEIYEDAFDAVQIQAHLNS